MIKKKIQVGRSEKTLLVSVIINGQNMKKISTLQNFQFSKRKINVVKKNIWG